MTDDIEEGVETVALSEIYLQDGTCWILDPDALAPSSEAEGVIAIQFRDGDLFYLDGETRKWCNAEAPAPGASRSHIRPVN